MNELLAPAGTLECAVAAFEAGADAVYAGVSRFNARERNRNFTYDEMSRLSRYTKDFGKKFYVTMNTLIKNDEIDDFTAELESLSRLEPDALIVQDWGAVKICRDFFPEFRLHASTQAGIHNRAGLRTAARAGIARVILERQLTLAEIAALAENRPTELEVFIHGALCCSLSGMCCFSSIQGGFSGNRGKCKQPCRRLYRSADNVRSPIFSPDDLQAVPLIHSLKQLGIDSFKIEGRLKRVDYVHKTVSAYRLLLDNDASDKKVIEEAERILKGTAVRAVGIGFYDRKSRKTLLGKPSRQTGEAAAVLIAAKGFQRTAKALVEVKLGDKLRIGGVSDARIVTLKRIESNGKAVSVVRPGRIFTFEAGFSIAEGKNSNEVVLYRIGAQIGKSPEFLERMKRFDDRRPLPLTVKLTGEAVTVAVTGFPQTEQRLPYRLAAAETSAVDEETLRRIFSRCGGVDWKAGEVTADVEGRWFVPVSLQKQWRRKIEEVWSTAPVAERPRCEAVRAAADAWRSKTVLDETLTVFGCRQTPDGRSAVRCVSEAETAVAGDELLLPCFLSDSDVELWRRHVEEAASRGIKRFRLTSLFQLDFSYPADAVLTVSYPLPAVNAFAARFFIEHGCNRIQIWPELNDDEAVAAAASFGCACERRVSGDFPVLATRAAVCESAVFSADGEPVSFSWRIRSDRQTGLNFLFPDRSIAAAPISGCGEFFTTVENPSAAPLSFPGLR